MYRCVVAGTDFSDTAAIAIERASVLAGKLGAKLVLVHAGEDSEGRLKTLAEKHGAEPVVTPGPPADVLIAEFQRAGGDLLAVGSVGMSGARRFLLGSVPNKVSHHSPGDVLIVKTDPPPKDVVQYSKILVGTDGSPTATRAVDAAGALASKLGAKTTILTAYEPPTEQEMRRLRGDPNDPVQQWGAGSSEKETPAEFRWRIAGASQAEDVLDRARDHAASQGVDAEAIAVEGSPADALIKTAEEGSYDLIVVGSVGMAGAKRLMLGNVPNRVSHHAPTDVLILHTT